FDIPIVHVNADDPEAALAAIRLALAYRRRFGHDVVVDLVGYRRHGHNEQDEAAYTQPILAAAIADHATAREQFAARLVADGDITQAQADELEADVATELRSAHEALKETFGQPEAPPRDDTHVPAATGDEVVTAVAAGRLRSLNEQLLRVPEGFTPHPKLMRQLERRREALVLWEAQFGDFVNGAQIIIDQFIAAGLSKWRESTRLTLLLPHGYEGNGPEHSSARLERFLQLAAQENLRIANCTTSGQYFHLLRRQALDATARPLVVMTPKGLLRLKQAGSTLEDLAGGEFSPVLDDPGYVAGRDRARVERLVLCQGKI